MSRANGAAEQRLRLRAMNVSLRAEEVLTDPALTALAIDDLCWEIALWQWTLESPHRWQWRRTSRWRADESELWQERRRIRDRARLMGFTIT